MAQVERISHLPKPHLSKKSKNPKPNTETQPKSSLTTKTPHTPIFYGPTSSEAGPSNSGQKNGHPGASDLSSVTRKRLDELSRMHVALAQGIPEIPSSICGSPRPPPSSSPEPSASSVRRGKQRMREDVMAPALSPHPREMEETEQEKAKEESEMSPGVLDDVLAGIESSLARNPRIRRLRNKIYAALEDCNFDTSNGKWSVLSALVRTGVIAGGTRWVGARADGVAPSVPALLGLEDSKEATKGSPLGWCNAETEEEWFKWEKRFDEEMTFRKRVEQWKQGIVAGVPEEDEQQPNVSQHPDDPQSSFSRPNQSDSYEALYGAPNHKPLQRKDSSGIFRPPSKSPKKNLATILSNTRKAKPRTIVSNAHAMLRTAGPDKVHKLATSFADAHARTNAASSKRNPLLDDPLKDTSTPLGFAMGKRGAASRVSAKRAKPTMQDKERHQLSQSRSQSQFQGQEKDHPHSQQQHSDTFELYGTHDGGRDEREITTQERRALANDISFPSRKITDLSADSVSTPFLLEMSGKGCDC
ncbi:hypothetical protein FA15DRAFT_143164 [Coprinopsis marcescibilis]|uniref:Uncharacterized protein n=1 Tax=Coprinopsis marcescibilis TaxID=230819 RepID=A0A5C3KJN8_COPMA|nr:hypothetical protein FA15DRAFT_143164 [Coprinopsis marcescibilis]